MTPTALRKSKEEFKNAIASQVGIEVKAAAYLQSLRNYRIGIFKDLIEKAPAKRLKLVPSST